MDNGIANFVHEFISGPEQFGRADMTACMRRAGLTQPEIDHVIREVEAAREGLQASNARASYMEAGHDLP